MPTLSAEQKIQNMASFIKKQSSEMLYKLNQLDGPPDSDVLRHVENLCEAAEVVRKALQYLTGTPRETLSVKEKNHGTLSRQN